MFAKCDKHYPSRSRQTSLARAVINFTKPVTKNNFGPSTGINTMSALRPGGCVSPNDDVVRLALYIRPKCRWTCVKNPLNFSDVIYGRYVVPCLLCVYQILHLLRGLAKSRENGLLHCTAHTDGGVGGMVEAKRNAEVLLHTQHSRAQQRQKNT